MKSQASERSIFGILYFIQAVNAAPVNVNNNNNNNKYNVCGM
jgi:hypothetical protein